MQHERFQTVTLGPGRHRNADGAVCAMELASMLAHDRFSDHPASVCPVIAAFLRGYNDAAGRRLRSELFSVAGLVVGSRTAGSASRERRAEALRAFAVEVWGRQRRRTPWPPMFPPENAFGDIERVGAYVARRARRDRGVHEATVTFLEGLIADPELRDAGAPANAAAPVDATAVPA